MLLRCLLPLALLPLAAVASAACTLTDPTLTLQSYRVDAQKERIAMYWQDRHGKAWGSLRSLLAGIDGDGRVQMAMNGGIYDKAYAPLGLYIEDGKRLTPVNRSAGGGTSLSAPAAYSMVENGRAKIVPLPAYKPSPAIRYAVQSGPMLIENGVINWRLKPSASSRKLRNGVGIDKQGRVGVYAQRSRDQLLRFCLLCAVKAWRAADALSRRHPVEDVPQRRQRAVAVSSVRDHDNGGEKIAGAFGDGHSSQESE